MTREEFIRKNLLNCNGKLNSRKMNLSWHVKNGFEEQYHSIMISETEFETYTEKCLFILNGGYCQTCSKKIVKGYYCSLECANTSSERTLKIVDSWKSTDVKQKQKQTFFNRYGVISNFHRKGVQDKIVHKNHSEQILKTFQQRYGVNNPSQLDTIQKIKHENTIRKYGVNHPSQKHVAPIFEKLQSQEWWNSFETIYDVRESLTSWLSISNIYIYTHRFRPDLIGKNVFISRPHQKIINLLNQHSIEHVVNDRSLIAPKELDIFIPSHSLAIEVNGLYWHCELHCSDPEAHEKKFQQCQQHGIQLLQFWDFEVNNQFDLICSMLSSHLHLNHKIYARQCSLIQLSAKDTFDFLKENHIQGGIRKKSHALVYKNNIVSLMILNNNVLERFASIKNLTVVGGMSKLLKSFNFDYVISYSDNRYSDGAVYKTLGFDCLKSSGLKYYYTKDFFTLEPRWKFMKKHIAHLGDIKQHTEKEIMKQAGYFRVWGCDGKTWQLKLKNHK